MYTCFEIFSETPLADRVELLDRNSLLEADGVELRASSAPRATGDGNEFASSANRPSAA